MSASVENLTEAADIPDSWKGCCEDLYCDEVPTKLSKQEERVLDIMHRISVVIWKTGEWPEEWTFSTFIPLPKKGDLEQCANYRTIALVSHASKILLQIILERIRVKTEAEIADEHFEQAGFRQGRETRSNHESQNTDVQGMRAPTTTVPYMCFVDFKKASISHDKLWMTDGHGISSTLD